MYEKNKPGSYLYFGLLFESCSAMRFTFICWILLLSSCSHSQSATAPSRVICGDERMDELIPLLKNKNVAVLVNQTAMVGQTHLIDTLLSQGVRIKKIFAPEHGYRGNSDAGAELKDEVDSKTGLPVVSLYGAKKKPGADDLKGIDVVVFDIQDVGTRFYTFISTLHYLMEACAENNKEVMVLDRPNPNGWYVDGPVLQAGFQSFVGVDPIPVVHGLTVGEYAQMVNGEHWLGEEKKCKLSIIPCLNYTHQTRYSLPVKPSPNLPNDVAIYLYPSLCFFEGTDISVGRGTDFPFQVIGSPNISSKNFSFTPESKAGATSPPHLGKECHGLDLRNADMKVPGIQLHYLIEMMKEYKDKKAFFLPNNFFDKLAGNSQLRNQLLDDKTAQEIKDSWGEELNAYKAKRKAYLLYPDFKE